MIYALSDKVIKTIGSCQVITDPVSAVKELVENALDACSTTIMVEISSNALDTIRVRDNGNGIAPEDRPLACKRHCTSKIRDFSDLKNVGGKFLGFRGESLASLTELSGTLEVITRVEGEEVGVALTFDRDGEPQRQENASHPVGTTVKVADLFKYIPVRKEAASKVSSKHLAKIKFILHAYALARPLVRFSLRVSGAKTRQADWTHVPKSGATVHEAAISVAGRDCAKQCVATEVSRDGFRIQLFAPSPDSDAGKVSNKGAFLSIDSRPVLHNRGTLKQIVTAFRTKLKACNAELECVRDPFLRMNIDCPPNSYDPNIEPAKDDLLFDDGEGILRVVQGVFDELYSRRSGARSPRLHQQIEDSLIHLETPQSPVTASSSEFDPNSPQVQQQRGSSNMYSGLDELEEIHDIGYSPEAEADGEHEEETYRLGDPNVSNPWIIAKMNASMRPKPTAPLRNYELLMLSSERMSSPTDLTVAEAPAEAQLYPLPTPEPSSSPVPMPRASRSVGSQPERRCGRIDGYFRNNKGLSAVEATVQVEERTLISQHQGPQPQRTERDHASQLPDRELESDSHRACNRPNELQSSPTPQINQTLPKKRNRSTNNPAFVSPLLKKPCKTISTEKPRNFHHVAQTQLHDIDIRNAISSAARRAAVKHVAGPSNNGGHVINLEDDQVASPVNNPGPTNTNALSCIPLRPLEYRDQEPARMISTEATHSLVVTLSLSIVTIASLCYQLDALHTTKSGTGQGNWLQGLITPTCLSPQRQSDDIQSPLLHPPVTSWEIAQWNAQLRQLVDSKYHGAGNHIQLDIATALQTHSI